MKKNNLQRVASLVLAAVLSASLLAGCKGSSGTPSSGTGETSAAGGTSAAGAEGSSASAMAVTMGMGSAWADLIPYNGASGGYYSQLVLGLLYDRLFYLSMDGSVTPRNAAGWEIADDRLSIVFHLNKDAVWSDGEPVTANDYVFAARMITDPACTANHTFMYSILTGVDNSGKRTGTAEEIGAEAVDDYTLKYTFQGPISQDVTFPSYLYLYQPLPEHLLKDTAPADYVTNALWNNPVGSGPLVFESTIAGSELVMTSNQKYYLGAPQFAKFKITVMANSNMASALLAGDIDLAYPPMSVDDINSLEGSANLNVAHQEVATQPYMLMVNNLSYTDPRIRQALNLAINREAICTMLQKATPLESPIMAGTKYNDSSITYKYDPEAAKTLLEAAAADGSIDLAKGITLHTPSGAREKVANIMQQNFEAVGLKTAIKVEEAATMFAGFYDGTTEMGLVNMTMQSNPMYLKSMLTHESASFINWPDSTWDDYYTSFMKAETDDERVSIVKEMQKEWLEQEPIIFYAATYEDYACNKRLGDDIGLEDLGLGNIPVWTWKTQE
ncbi:ABC transporter substrate-binding protein [Lacrimispora sp.]|uniref:ABC transporter substrate-binding protein n=1 Tax=Lacrimispora sp. TaxID=2719234 RepID=UPI0028991FF6|nr:ABC transporter substrate-binding protein [Lacrimispora sp.]